MSSCSSVGGGCELCLCSQEGKGNLLLLPRIEKVVGSELCKASSAANGITDKNWGNGSHF